jgi:SAM-dependent methyltransferase
MLRLKAPLVLFGRRVRANAFLRDARVAVRTLFGDTAGDRLLLTYLNNRTDLSSGIAELYSEMPQATLVDHTVTECRHDDWRKKFAARLQGRGVELGPLHRPVPLPEGSSAASVDREPREALQKKYPHVAAAIGDVDILDDAETLTAVGDASFDFLVAGHVIEHMRYPMRSLRDWLRVVRPGGLVYLIVPDKRRTFDRHRVRTTLEHHILDYLQPSAERDLEHYLDYARYVYHHEQDQAIETARRLSQEDESIHVHTFIPEDIVAIVRWMSSHVTPVEIEMGPAMSPEEDEFHLLLRKPATGG